MGKSEPESERLTEARLGAGDLRRVAGLTYRQLNEWDKREALPCERKGEGGWRKVSAWQAMALRIVADLHRRFGIPLAKQRLLLGWLLGELPTMRQHMRVLRAEDWLSDFSEAEKARDNVQMRTAIKHGRDLGNGVMIVRLDGGPVGSDATVSRRPKPAVELAANIRLVVPRLTKRGWSEEAARDFAGKFFSLSLGHRTGVEAIRVFRQLQTAARAADDSVAMRASSLLVASLVPVFEALLLIRGGFPVLLVTDLNGADILEEPTYVDWLRAGLVPESAIVLRVNDHINAVLEAVGTEAIPVTSRAAKAESAEETQVVELLRKRDFDRLVIEPKGGGLRLELQRDVSPKDEEEVVRRLREHDYQTVTVKKRHGKVVCLTQSLSLITESPDHGRIPTPRPKPKRT